MLLKNFLVDINNDVLFIFLDIYCFKFLEKNLHHQFYRKKWQTSKNNLDIALKLIQKSMHNNFFIFQFYKKAYKEKEEIF